MKTSIFFRSFLFVSGLLFITSFPLWGCSLGINSDEIIEFPQIKAVEDADLNIPLLDISAAPSAMVAGAVNVITGSFVDFGSDLATSGALPMQLQRSYSSRSTESNLGLGWSLNLPSSIDLKSHKKPPPHKPNNPFQNNPQQPNLLPVPQFQETIYTARVCDRGAVISFIPNERSSHDLQIDPEQLRHGVTNCANAKFTTSMILSTAA
jgi:hypothetical protein